jgi:hypothetical protein
MTVFSTVLSPRLKVGTGIASQEPPPFNESSIADIHLPADGELPFPIAEAAFPLAGMTESDQ